MRKSDTNRLKVKKPGQAMLELSIMGTLFLSLLALLISSGVRFNAQQELMMESFRHAVKEASKEGVADEFLSYSAQYLRDIPVADVSSPYGVPELSSVSAGATATRTYFMQTAERAVDDAMYRQHYFMNDEEIERGGFRTEGLKKNISVRKIGENQPVERTDLAVVEGADPDDLLLHLQNNGYIDSSGYVTSKFRNLNSYSRMNINIPRPGGWGVYDPYSNQQKRQIFDILRGKTKEYGVIRQIPDPVGDLYPPRVYWTWIEIRTGSLKQAKDSKGAQTDKKISNAWQIINRGIDLSRQETISYKDLYRGLRSQPVIAQGVILHPDCLVGIDSQYPVSVVEVDGRVHIKGSEWAQINTQAVRDPETAMRRPAQGLAEREKRVSAVRELKLESGQEDRRHTTRTDVDYEKYIKRYIILDSGDEIEIKSGIREQGARYLWETDYE